MKEKAVEIFARGNRAWPALLPGEPPGRPYILETLLGQGPFRVLHVSKALKMMSCYELHPQLLVVAGNNGVVQLFGCSATFPGFCFSKKRPRQDAECQPQHTPETVAKIEQLTKLILTTIDESEAVDVEMAALRAEGFNIRLGLGVDLEGGPGPSEPIKSLVSGDGSVPNELFTKEPGDPKFLKGLHIKLDEKYDEKKDK